MKGFGEWKTELEQVMREVDEETKDWSDKDYDNH